MDRKEKNRKKKIISKYLDLGNGHYRDEEIDTLHELATNREKYDGTSKRISARIKGWSSDGKFIRDEETTYTFRADDDGIHINKRYEYHDDDGQSGEYDTDYDSGRDILNIIKSVFKG